MHYVKPIPTGHVSVIPALVTSIAFVSLVMTLSLPLAQ